MSAAFKLDLTGLKRLVAKFDSPTVKAEIQKIPQKKEVAAIVAQAIADNFDQQGPGWKPLQAKTIRATVSKKLKKKLSDMTDKQLLRHEAKARKMGSKELPHRMILQKTGLLKKSATTPGVSENIYRTEGSNLIWGSNLVYAGVHNRGDAKKNIPKREFLVIRDVWKQRLWSYIAEEIQRIIRRAIRAEA